MRLTPEGMFFADSVAGLFAWQRVEAVRGVAAGQHTRELLGFRDHNDSMG
jgi:hypothetical protein